MESKQSKLRALKNRKNEVNRFTTVAFMHPIDTNLYQ